jgi:sugar/nucleoside kinase (ribokinase family)
MDIFARLDDDFDSRITLFPPVAHIQHTELIEILGIMPEFTICSGGGAANAAKIAGLLGIKTGFIGAVGAGNTGELDHFGKLFERELSGAGVTAMLRRKALPTGIFAKIDLPDGETRILAAPSAALELDEDDIPEDSIRSAKAMILDGYMLGRTNLFRYILELASRYGTVAALDLGSTEIAASHAREIAVYCRNYPLILFMNEAEASAFYQAQSRTAKDKEAGLQRIESPERREEVLHDIGDFFQDFTRNDIFPIIVVKLGPKGAAVFAGGKIYREETISVIPLETTGAGDTFCAAFIAAWVRECSLSQCANIGNRAAGEVLNVCGVQIDRTQLAPLAKLLKKKTTSASIQPLDCRC